jgi:hypothetical protein
MAITVKHSKVSTIPDDADTSLVRPSDWNADHTLVGTVPVANGGTGASTANGGFNALAPSQTGNSGKYLTTNGTDASWATVSGGSGTVTSVAATAGTGISVTGSPITTSGTLTITNTAPDQTVSIASGTGISATGTYPAFTVTNTLPDLTVALTGAGTTTVTGTYPNFTITSADSKVGDVVGPASSTDNAVARFDTTTGKLIQNSLTTIDDTGILATSKGLIGSGANFTDYPSAQFVSTQSKISGYGHAYKIGVVGEAQASSSDSNIWGIGVHGRGWTNNATRCAGLEGDAGVTNSADTGTATAVRANSTSTHAGGLNIGVTVDASGSSVGNYAIYMINGNLFSAAAQTWDLVDNSNSALVFNSVGKTGILDIITTNGAEGISTSGTLSVTGTTSLGTLGVTGTSTLSNVAITGTTSFDGSQGTAGQVLTSAGTGSTPTWTTPTTGTVTSVTGTAPVVSSGGATPAISMPAATTSVDGYLTSTDWNTFNGKGAGTVTSVAATVPSFLSVTGSPITSSGTLALSYSGTALPILNGGTGQTTANDAFNALAPSQTSNSGKYLTTDGTNTSWATVGGTTYTRTEFTATASQTTFSVTYTVGLIEVYVNGVLLNGADYTASNGTSVVLSVACSSGDIVEFIAFSSFSVASTVSSLSGGTTGLTPSTATTGNVTLGGTLAVANGGTGVTTSTGSGAVVLGTSPTLTTPTITSFYGQNTNLVTSPYSDTGLIPAELIYRLNTAYVGTATTSAQSFFGVGVTLSGSTVYQFEAIIAISKTVTASLHNLQLSFGGTATLNNIAYEYYQPVSSITSFNDTTSGAVYTGFIQTASATTIASPSLATVFKTLLIKGTVSVNAGGTFIPQYTTSVSVGPYTTAIGSYFKLSPLGAAGANTSIGTWA